ncbi:MAG: peptidylprolyl isomerase [Pseudomonadota bacterium]
MSKNLTAPFNGTRTALKRAAVLTFGVALMTLGLTSAAQSPRPSPFPTVEFKTSKGTFQVQLNARRAPLTVQNFLKYVNDGHYNGTIFHRVIGDFMAQGGGFDTDMTEKPTRNPVVNESGNGLSNARGTIAMARTGDPHSGTAQFFINLVDNQRLDPNPRRWGYTVFGEVVSGMEVLDAIALVPTAAKPPFRSDVPVEPIVIETVTVAKPKTP